MPAIIIALIYLLHGLGRCLPHISSHIAIFIHWNIFCPFVSAFMRPRHPIQRCKGNCC